MARKKGRRGDEEMQLQQKDEEEFDKVGVIWLKEFMITFNAYM